MENEMKKHKLDMNLSIKTSIFSSFVNNDIS